jgi:hypothetical protein
MAPILAFLLLFLAGVQADEKHINIAITIEDQKIPAFLAAWSPEITTPIAGNLQEVTPADACSPITSEHKKGSVLIANQGQCAFADKMTYLKAFDPAAIIIVGKESAETWIQMGPAQIPDPLPAVMVLHKHGEILRDLRDRSAVFRSFFPDFFSMTKV